MPPRRPAAKARPHTSHKILRLLEWMQRPGGVRAMEAMTELSLDARTLRRYLADYRRMAIPVIDEGRALGRVLSIDPSYRRAGVELTLLEAVCLRFGRTLFDFLEGTQFASDMDDALERLEPIIRRADLARIDHLERKFMAVPEHRKIRVADADVMDEILSALLYENPVICSYARPGGDTRSYELHPYTLAVYRQALYLFARDVEDDRVKTFAVDRFVDLKRRRKEEFAYPSDFDPEAFVADAFGIISGKLLDVTLRFRPEVTPFVRERIWHRSQRLEPEPDGGITLRMHVGHSQELVSWLLGFGPSVRVLEPRALQDEVARLHREAVMA